MHWQAAIKTSPPPPSPAPVAGIRLQASSLTLAASRVAFAELQSYILPFVLFFFLPPPTPSILSLLRFHTCFLLSSRHFSSFSLRLQRSVCFCQTDFCVLPGPVFRQDTEPACERGGGGGGEMDDPKLSADTCCMLALTRPCALGGLGGEGGRSPCARLSQHKSIFWGLTRRFAVMLNDC